MREGDAATVVTTGTLATKVAEAADVLAAEGIRLTIVGVTRLKPLSKELCIAVVEEHSIHGGLADLLSCELDKRGIPHLLHRNGIEDRFGESGHPQKLLEAFGLAGAPLCERLRSIAGR
jgi:transketolase